MGFVDKQTSAGRGVLSRPRHRLQNARPCPPPDCGLDLNGRSARPRVPAVLPAGEDGDGTSSSAM